MYVVFVVLTMLTCYFNLMVSTVLLIQLEKLVYLNRSVMFFFVRALCVIQLFALT